MARILTDIYQGHTITISRYKVGALFVGEVTYIGRVSGMDEDFPGDNPHQLLSKLRSYVAQVKKDPLENAE